MIYMLPLNIIVNKKCQNRAMWKDLDITI